jgi:hybrid cluster-associated redox disulfide protein
MATVTKDVSIQELVTKHPEAIPVMIEAGLHCIGCAAAQFETLEQGCEAHGIDVGEVVKKINDAIKDKE